MKRKTKIGLALLTLFAGTMVLSGCTASFCTVCDNARILYAYDSGVTKYYDATDTTKPAEAVPVTIEGVTNIYSYANIANSTAITKVNETANNNGVEVPHIDYWAALDSVLLKDALLMSQSTVSSKAEIDALLYNYGYLKFTSDPTKEKEELWDNWSNMDTKAVQYMRSNGTYDICKLPTTDYFNQYKTTMNSNISTIKSCITLTEGDYGYYGYDGSKSSVKISAKSYSYAWSKGFLEGLLVWPIAALTDVLCAGMSGLGNGLNGTQGWAQLLTICIVTLIVRLIMFAVSFKSTMANAKMTQLQPEIAKIQAKYPNSNTNQSEKARFASETQALYKKNGVNPFSTIIVMIVQFPVFICVWSALIGSSWLATGSFCNMNFSDSISSILFNQTNWGNGSAVAALILFILMAAAQVVSMLLPQWLQKKKQANVAKLGKVPAQNSTQNTMKWVTYIMMIMIIIMGFSLASAMGVYWFIGALISIAQTLITNKITEKQAKEKKH